MPKCPVCKSEYSNGIQTCSNCGFTELGVSFLNPEDAADWAKHVVAPCKAVWTKTHSGASQSTLSLSLQLNGYFDYSGMIEQLTLTPQDYVVRSRLIDYLHQIYVYRFNYPVSDRKALLNEIIFHMSCIDAFAATTKDRQLLKLALANTLMKAELHLANGEWLLAMTYYAKYLSDPEFEKDILEFKTDENPLLVQDDQYFFVLYNCKLICKAVKLPAMSNKFDALCRQVASIHYDFADHTVDLLKFCGVRFNIQSPHSSDSFNEHLRTPGNFIQQCTFEHCYQKTDYGDIYHSPMQGVWTGHECELYINTYSCAIQGVSDSIDMQLLEKQKHGIYSMGERILRIFSR